jgi:hypothetical protein
VSPEVEASVRQLVAIRGHLQAAVAGSETGAAMFASWDDVFGTWFESAGLAETSDEKFSIWQRVGTRLGTEAVAMANEVQSDTIAGEVGAFLSRMPKSLGTVLDNASSGVGQAAGRVLGNIAAPVAGAVVLPFLLIAGALAAGVYLLTRSGVKVRTPIASIGA